MDLTKELTELIASELRETHEVLPVENKLVLICKGEMFVVSVEKASSMTISTPSGEMHFGSTPAKKAPRKKKQTGVKPKKAKKNPGAISKLSIALEEYTLDQIREACSGTSIDASKMTKKALISKLTEIADRDDQFTPVFLGVMKDLTADTP